MKEHHTVETVRVEAGFLHLIVDGKRLELPLEEVSLRLAGARAEDLQQFEVSPSGYGIHWPAIDEDISIDGLLGISHERAATRRSA